MSPSPLRICKISEDKQSKIELSDEIAKGDYEHVNYKDWHTQSLQISSHTNPVEKSYHHFLLRHQIQKFDSPNSVLSPGCAEKAGHDI